MKKMISIIFCTAMAFSLSACGGSKVSDDALNALEKAIANIADMKSADYQLEMVIDAASMQQTATVKGSYDVSTAEPKISMSIGMEQDKQKVDDYMSFYVNKDTMYINLMNLQKGKIPLSTAKEQSGLSAFNFDKESIKLPKDELKKVLKEASLKDTTLSLKFDTKKMMEVLEEKNATATASLKNVNIDDCTMTVELEKDRMTSANLKFTMTKTTDGKTENANMTITLTFKNINKVKEVVFPDFSDYVESENSGIPGIV